FSRLTNGCVLECGVRFRQLRTCRRTRPGQRADLWPTSPTMVSFLLFLLVPCAYARTIGRRREILIHPGTPKRLHSVHDCVATCGNRTVYTTCDAKEQDHDDGCGPVRRYSVANRPPVRRLSGE